MDKNNLALVEEKDLALVENNLLNRKQLSLLLAATPKKYTHKRPAKGGGEWEYVTGGYVKKVLNLMFGWDWDFEIIKEELIHGEVVVRGQLTVRVDGKNVVKSQYGNKEIVYKTDRIQDEKGQWKKVKTDKPLSIGNDLKAAATDCLKKCAAELGIAADIYNKQDFNPVKIKEPILLDDLRDLFMETEPLIPDEEVEAAEIMINSENQAEYERLHNYLTKLKNNVNSQK